jgi:voltage-gated potassium channel Kch
LAAPLLMLLKGVVLYGLLRGFGSNGRESREIALVLSQAGEFGFVLFAAASAGALISAQTASLLTALVALTMAATPFVAMAADALEKRFAKGDSLDDMEAPEGSGSAVIVAGFGRVGQIVSQMLLARGLPVIMVDTQPSRIRTAREFGARVYYGNGLRVDVLRAAGAEDARMVILCTDKDEVTRDAVNAIRRAFPHLLVLVRAHDRQHMVALHNAEIDFAIRETFESSVVLGREALLRLGVEDVTVTSIEEEFRRRDADRLAMQIAEGDIKAGRELAYFQPTEPFDIGPT